MKAIVIAVSGTGEMRCVYNEVLPLETLGSLKVERASTVEFNEATQRWEVRLATEPDRVAFTDASRAACITWEINQLQASL